MNQNVTEEPEASTGPAGRVTSTTETEHTPSPPPPSPPLGPPSARGPQGRPPSRGKVALAVGAVVLALASGVAGALGALALDDDDDQAPISSIDDTSSNDGNGRSDSDQEDDAQPDEPLSQAAAEVLPSVVSITAGGEQFSGQGSGVIISDEGYVLTNNHVVAQAENGGDLSVTLADGTTASAEIVGRDPASDLAVIQIQDVDELSAVTPASLGSSSDLVVGDTVLAIGSPLGLDGSVTSGIVSALNRAITLSGDSSPFGGGGSATTAVIDAIQTDTAINPGNSGGPLVNTDGDVVGINSAIASLAQGTTSQSGNIGVGFAIPIDDARDVADQLIEDGEVTYPFLGVQLADTIEGRDDQATGPVVAGVEEGSPAEDAGLQEGDVVTAIDGEPVRDSAALTAAIRSHAPGEEVTLTIRRDDGESEVTATLGTLDTAGD
ncbi:MAG: S1C family serine protease [Acidimicrobiales bacterium]